MLSISSLNSGSNGNCYYVGNDTEAILVDAGISCREIERRMKRSGLDMQKVKAVFVSHEHTDHIRGIPTLASRYRLPVYITSPTQLHGRLALKEQAMPFKAYEPVAIGELTVTAFPKFHDASDPYSFIVSCRGINVGVFTDIGFPCEHVIRNFKECHAAFLEANYDEDMLQNGRYPYHLKKRISGERGHLSNHQALELFKTHHPAFMSHLLLSHLSKENNCPQLVHNLFSRHAGKIQVVVASRFGETAVYRVGDIIADQPARLPLAVAQLQLAFA